MSESSPFSPPGETAADAVTLPPMFKPNTIGIASLLGGVLAGGALLALNHRALGTDRVWTGPAVAFGALCVVTPALILLPDSFPSAPVPIAFALGFRAWAHQLHANGYGTGRDLGGAPNASSWVAFGVGFAALLLTVMLVLSAAIGLALLLPE